MKRKDGIGRAADAELIHGHVSSSPVFREPDTEVAPLAATKAHLEAQLAELEARQKRIGTDLAEPLNRDSSEQAVEMEDDAGLEAEAALVKQEAASVKRALSRIADGTYGQCIRCGAVIAPARLEARPEAALCIDCAQNR